MIEKNKDLIYRLSSYFLVLISLVWLLKRFYLVSVHYREYQWDFFVYFSAVNAYFVNGLNPYVVEDLARINQAINVQDHPVVPFLYPYISLYLFYPLTWFSWETSYYACLFLKPLYFCGIGYLFLKTYEEKKVSLSPWLIIWLTLGFSGCLNNDLKTGNIALYMNATILLAMIAVKKQRWFLFFFASLCPAIIKVYPLIFSLSPALLAKGRLRWAIPCLTVSGVVLLFMLGYLFDPDRSMDFFSLALPTLFDRTFALVDPLKDNNCGVARLAHDIFYLISGKSNYFLGTVVWLNFSAIVMGTLSYLVYIKRMSSLQRVCLIIFTYGLINPRVVEYTYSLFLFPAVLVFTNVMKQSLVKYIVAVSCLPSFTFIVTFLKKMIPYSVLPTFSVLLDSTPWLLIFLFWTLTVENVMQEASEDLPALA
jgi:hypothetical protein